MKKQRKVEKDNRGVAIYAHTMCVLRQNGSGFGLGLRISAI